MTLFRRVGTAFCAVLTLLVAEPRSADADVVVVSATAPGFPPGRVIKSDEEIALPDGAAITFLTQSGQIASISGPHRGVVVPPEGDSGIDVSAVLTGSGERLRSLGGTRGTAQRPREAPAARGFVGTVSIDPRFSGTYCLQPGDALFLTRSAGSSALELTDLSSGGKAEFLWAEDSDRQPWPPALDIFDGAAFLARDDSKVEPARLTFRILPGPFASESAWIAAMALEGCGQSASLLEYLRNEVARLDVFLTSDRGVSPTYRRGETLELRLMTSRDAYVVCFYVGAGGDGLVLFPTQYSGGARVSAQSGLSLPGPRLPIDLTLSEPPGQERVTCYAADNDITASLPAEVRAGDLRALDAATISAAVDQLADPGDAGAVASLVLTIR